MGLETGSYISDLSADNPTAVDQKSQGDDHIRLIKTCLKNTFPSATKPVYSYRSVDTITNANYTASVPTDFGKMIAVSLTTANRTMTLPTPADDIYDGASITFIKIDPGKYQVRFSGSIAQAEAIYLHQTYQKATFTWNKTLALWLPFVEYVQPRGSAIVSMVNDIPGYIELRGGTLGETGSGGTYANDYYRGIYQVLWDTLSNTLAPVAGGRGASATADFEAGKLMTLPNYDGNAIAQIASAHAIGTEDGSETHTLTAAELPQLSGTGTAASGGSHTHGMTNEDDLYYDTGSPPTATGQPVPDVAGAGANPDRMLTKTPTVSSGGAHTHSVTVTVNAGTADAHSILQPTCYWRVLVKS